MNTFIFFVTLVVTVAAVVIVLKMVTGLFFRVAKVSQSFVLFVQNKWNATTQQRRRAKAEAKAMATRKNQQSQQDAEDLAKYKEIAEAKARSLSEAAKAPHPVFSENRDWSEYEPPAYLRKGKVFVF